MGYLSLTIARQMEEVLQGKKQNPSDKLRKEVAMEPPTNSVSERVIGSFDRYMREKLNATTLNLESTILFEKSKISFLVKFGYFYQNLYLDMTHKSARDVTKDDQKTLTIYWWKTLVEPLSKTTKRRDSKESKRYYRWCTEAWRRNKIE